MRKFTLSSVLDDAGRNWPAPPSTQERPSSQAVATPGFLFSGNINETVPRRLLLDSRLTPLERNAWQAFRYLLDKQGFAAPRYQDLQPFLGMVPYRQASKETVARTLAILRMTRWITLVTRGRDAVTGRIQGAIYLLHDEPISVAETLDIDASFETLVASGMKHSNKSVRIIAQEALKDIQESDGELPTRIEVLAARIHRQSLSEPGEMSKAIPGSDSEPGDETLVRNPNQAENHPVRIDNSLGSESEPRLKPNEIDRVRNPNQATEQYCTSTDTSICTVPYSTGRQIVWPESLKLSATEKHTLLIALQDLPEDLQQQLLDEAASRISTGNVRNPAGYLRGLINKARNGEFKPWAMKMNGRHQSGSAGPEESNKPATVAPEAPEVRPERASRTSEIAQRCFAEIRRTVFGPDA